MSMATAIAPSSALKYRGYHQRQDVPPDNYLTQVGRGTPCGEYLRRFWHPVAYVHELNADSPLKVRVLGEDLIVFRDKSARYGVLHLHCCHRNTSLEFGVVEERGVRCCYHGRVFDVDGTILEVPGDPAADRIKELYSQGAYPTHEFGGIVFCYMGPPERIPAFPHLDRFDLPGLRIEPGIRFDMACNWLQVKENATDAHHTEILHVLIPKLRGQQQFSEAFSEQAEFTWVETPGGMAYLAARFVGENVWVRTVEVLGPTMHSLSSVFERGDRTTKATTPFLTLWTLPVDDDHTINFFVSHVGDKEPIPFERRRQLEIFGQYEDRPYAERQRLPGDHEAMVSQGRVNLHATEHLGTFDRGIGMLRRYLRKNIEAVERGEDPHGFYLKSEDVPPTFANDFIWKASDVGLDPNDRRALGAFAHKVVKDYESTPPMVELKRILGAH
jgi:phenylpropionate dioxygenase-like ring-hydroxylating dioxygenase large terminal subunit